MEEAQGTWADENADDIEAYNDRQAQIQAAKDNNEPVPELDEGQEEPVKPVFDMKFFEFNFEAETPPVVIPDEVVDDIDNDWKIVPEDRDAVIEKYLANQEEVAP